MDPKEPCGSDVLVPPGGRILGMALPVAPPVAEMMQAPSVQPSRKVAKKSTAKASRNLPPVELKETNNNDNFMRDLDLDAKAKDAARRLHEILNKRPFPLGDDGMYPPLKKPYRPSLDFQPVSTSTPSTIRSYSEYCEDALDLSRDGSSFISERYVSSSRSFVTDHYANTGKLDGSYGMEAESPMFLKALLYDGIDLCKACGIEYSTSQALKKHLKNAHHVQLIKAGEASEVEILDNEQFLEFVQSTRPAGCRYCGTKYKYLSCMLKHEMTCSARPSGSTEHFVSLEGVTSDVSPSSAVREFLDNGIRVFQCLLCGLALGDRSTFFRHFKREHEKPQFQNEAGVSGFDNEAGLPQGSEQGMKMPIRIEGLIRPIKKEKPNSGYEHDMNMAVQDKAFRCSTINFKAPKADDHDPNAVPPMSEGFAKFMINGVMMWKCLVCMCDLSRKSNLKRHYGRHTKYFYQCPYCSLRIKTIEEFRLHKSTCESRVAVQPLRKPKTAGVKAVISTKVVKVAPKSNRGGFKSKAEKTNIPPSRGIKKVQVAGIAHFRCVVCNQRAKYRSILEKHYRCHYSGDKEISCQYCNYKSTTLEEHKTHELDCFSSAPTDVCTPTQARQANGSFKCHLCNRVFWHVYNYKRHAMTHSGVGAFKCDQCGRRFKGFRERDRCDHSQPAETKPEADENIEAVTESDLQPQEESGDEKPRKKKSPMEGLTHGEVMNWAKKLLAQSKKHSNKPKRYLNLRGHKCPICKKGFASKSCIRTHLMYHAKGPPEDCPHCGKSFVYHTYRERHISICNGPTRRNSQEGEMDESKMANKNDLATEVSAKDDEKADKKDDEEVEKDAEVEDDDATEVDSQATEVESPNDIDCKPGRDKAEAGTDKSNKAPQVDTSKDDDTRDESPAEKIDLQSIAKLPVMERRTVDTGKGYSKVFINENNDKCVYECNSCKRIFREHEVAVKHVKIHKAFQCKLCEKSFPTFMQFRRHQIMAHGVQPIEECDDSGSDDDVVISEESEDSDEEMYIDMEEDMNKDIEPEPDVKPSPQLLNRLMKSVADDDKMPHSDRSGQGNGSAKPKRKRGWGRKKYSCEFCHRVLKTAAALYKHRVSHLGPIAYPCSECDMKFSSVKKLKQHAYEIHNVTAVNPGKAVPKTDHETKEVASENQAVERESPLPAAVIRAKGTTSPALTDSSGDSQRTGKSRGYLCPGCHKRIKSDSQLYSHMNLCIPDQPGSSYACCKCGDTFLFRAAHIIHEQGCKSVGKKLDPCVEDDQSSVGSAQDSPTKSALRKRSSVSPRSFLKDIPEDVNLSAALDSPQKGGKMIKCLECQKDLKSWSIHKHIALCCPEKNLMVTTCDKCGHSTKTYAGYMVHSQTVCEAINKSTGVDAQEDVEEPQTQEAPKFRSMEIINPFSGLPIKVEVEDTYFNDNYLGMSQAAVTQEQNVDNQVAYTVPDSTNDLSKKMYVCSYCNREYKSHSGLDYHSKKCTGYLRSEDKGSLAPQRSQAPVNKPKHSGFPCQYCGDTFFHAALLQIHEASHSAKLQQQDLEGQDDDKDVASESVAIMSCKICGKEFTNKQRLYRHEKIHLNLKPFKCELCDRGFSRRDNLRAHEYMVHNIPKPEDEDGPSEVNPDSNEGLEEDDEMEAEINEDDADVAFTVKQQYQCTVCPVTCENLSSIKMHMLSHSQQKPHKCDKCDMSFSLLGNLNRHKLTHEGSSNPRNYVCPYCDKVYTQKLSLESHVLSHTGDRPYKCRFCPQSFNKDQVLKNHEKIHMEKAYECDICLKKFARNDAMKVHRLHHLSDQDKPYRCDMCDRGFVTRSQLDSHRKSHEAKPHLCRHCDKSFSTIGARIMHERQHTTNINYSCPFCFLNMHSYVQYKSHIATCRQRQINPR